MNFPVTAFLSIVLFVIPMISSAQLPGYVPVNGLEAFYTFDGGMADQSGNGVALTNYNCSLTADRDGNPNSAYDFSHALNSRFEGSFPAPLDTAYTFAAWIRRNTLLTGPGIHNKQWVFAHGTDLTNQSSSIGIRESSQILCMGNWDIDPPTGYTVGTTWVHIAVVATPTQRHLYVNCQLDTILNISYPIISSANFEIGSQIGTLFESWDGQMDDVGIWNRVLDPTEICMLYNATAVLSVETSLMRNLPEANASGPFLQVYPNPTIDMISVRTDASPDSPRELTIWNMLGQCVYQATLEEPSVSVLVRNLPGGYYRVEVSNRYGVREGVGLVVE